MTPGNTPIDAHLRLVMRFHSFYIVLVVVYLELPHAKVTLLSCLPTLLASDGLLIATQQSKRPFSTIIYAWWALSRSCFAWNYDDALAPRRRSRQPRARGSSGCGCESFQAQDILLLSQPGGNDAQKETPAPDDGRDPRAWLGSPCKLPGSCSKGLSYNP